MTLCRSWPCPDGSGSRRFPTVLTGCVSAALRSHKCDLRQPRPRQCACTGPGTAPSARSSQPLKTSVHGRYSYLSCAGLHCLLYLRPEVCNFPRQDLALQGRTIPCWLLSCSINSRKTVAVYTYLFRLDCEFSFQSGRLCLELLYLCMHATAG